MKRTIIILALLLITSLSFAQPVAGRWKLVKGYTLTYTDKKDDFLKEIYKDEPCLGKSIFVFTANGKLAAKDVCAKDSDAGPALGTIWKIIGSNKIQLSGDDDDPVIYELSFSGKNMIWKISYPLENVKRKDTDIKLLLYTFEKL